MSMRARLLVPLLAAATLLAPAVASAVTLSDIVALSKAGVSEPVILALIDRDKPIFTITPDDLIMLKKEGVTEAIVVAMLHSGRDEVPPPPQAMELPPPTEPNVIIVDRPVPQEPTVVT